MRRGYRYEVVFVGKGEGAIPASFGSDKDIQNTYIVCATSFEDAETQAKVFHATTPNGEMTVLSRIASIWHRSTHDGELRGRAYLHIPDDLPPGLVPIHTIGFTKKGKEAGNADFTFGIVVPTTDQAILVGQEVLKAELGEKGDPGEYRLVTAQEEQFRVSSIFPELPSKCVGLLKCLVSEVVPSEEGAKKT